MEADYILKTATQDQLEFLLSVKEHHQFKAFVKLLDDLRQYNMEVVFDSNLKSADELALLRASKRGEIMGYKTFLDLVKGASIELKRRKKEPQEVENLY